jgi:hypothetical protein
MSIEPESSDLAKQFGLTEVELEDLLESWNNDPDLDGSSDPMEWSIFGNYGYGHDPNFGHHCPEEPVTSVEEVEPKKGDGEEEPVKLCENMDCERYPPDWDAEQDTEETYQEDQWQKCCLCDGYFNDDGMGDILFVQEEPNNQEAGCSLCGKSEDVVQMKGTGQYLCGNACDEDDDDEDDE